MARSSTDNSYRDDVSAYVDALRSPDRLVDHARVEQLEARLDEHELPASERLVVMLELRSLRKVDLAPLEAKFIKAVPKYLDDFDLDLDEVRDDFLAVGVPPEVLDRVRTSGGEAGSASTSVSVDDVIAHIRGRTGGFTNADLLQATGASRGTVGKAVKRLVERGVITGSGGRPIVYTPSSQQI